MMNLVAAQIVSLPTGGKSDVAPKMPWPNGSLITAKMTAIDSEGSVILSLGGYRLRAQVPPNTPLGNVWLLLLSRDMPAQFRLLHEAHAASMLADMLAQKAVKDPFADLGKRVVHTTQQGWHKMDGEDLPFVMERGASGQYVMLYERQDGGARGVVHRQQNVGGFLLHGRVDLDGLGAVMFALHSIENKWKLSVYADLSESVDMLRGDFSAWINKQPAWVVQGTKKYDLEGHVMHDLPSEFSFLNGLEA
ncbi:MAG: hypothetical protein Q9M15_00655 [Mariprofundaceae bacterium]|nr:hypothetical protein [Mariprofundaceae bacterium]